MGVFHPDLVGIQALQHAHLDADEVHPEDFGFAMASNRSLKVEGPEQSRQMLVGVLDGQPGPARDIVLLNAGATLYAANVASSIADGIQRAREVLDSGAARAKLDAFVKQTQELGKS
jgi:anthranilate phosphoribosyltransferase